MKNLLRPIVIGLSAAFVLSHSAAAQATQAEYDLQTDAGLSAGISSMLVNPWPSDWHLHHAVMIAARDGVSPNLEQTVIDICNAYQPDPNAPLHAYNDPRPNGLLFDLYLKPEFRKLLSPQALAAIEGVCWRWVFRHSIMSNNSSWPLNNPTMSTWIISGSENHCAGQRAANLLSLQVLKRAAAPYGPSAKLNDGFSVAEHYEAWIKYYLEYFRQRAREGLTCEIEHPSSYGMATITHYMEIADLADDAGVRHAARQFLDLYWANVAAEFEPRTGLRASLAATRNYRDLWNQAGYWASSLLYAWGWTDVPSFPNLVFSSTFLRSYRPPLILKAIASDAQRGPYLSASRRFGRGSGWNNGIYEVLFDDGALRNSYIRRDTWYTTDYALSSISLDVSRSFIELVNQSRTVGVSFSGGGRFVAYASYKPMDPVRESNLVTSRGINSILGADCLIVARDPNAVATSSNSTRIFVSNGALWDNREEAGGWTFTRSGTGYAAFRVAGDAGYSVATSRLNNGYLLEFNDIWAPIVIQTAQASVYGGDFAAFKAAVQAKPFTYTSGKLTYTSLASDTFEYWSQSMTIPKVNGVNFNFNPTMSYDSPYVSMVHGEDIATISYGEYPDLVLNFSVPPVLMSLAPANGATNAPVGTYLVATFNETILAGTGNITLRRGADDSVVEVFDVESSPNLSFSGSELSINPSNPLDPQTAYYVEIAPTAIMGGDSFAGFSGPGTWAFTTGAETVTPPYTIINTDSKVVASALGNAVSTMSFTTGSWADLLVVAFSSEKSTEPYKISYNGVDLTLAIAGAAGSSADIWYLKSPYTGGAANLVVDMTGVSTVNGYGLGVMSVDAHGQEMVLHATAKNLAESPQSVTLSTTADNTLVVTSFNSNDTSGSASLNAPLTPLYVSTNIGSARGAAGYQTDVAAGSHTYGWSVTSQPRSAVAAAFVVQPIVAGNPFADWIALFPEVGEQNGFRDDPDGDGIPNGIENFFGTRPDQFSQGLIAGTANPAAGTYTFTHPQNDTPATNLTAAYVWSSDLVSFHADGSTDDAGTQVNFSTQINTPVAGTTTVTATLTGNPVGRLFVKVQVTEN